MKAAVTYCITALAALCLGTQVFAQAPAAETKEVRGAINDALGRPLALARVALRTGDGQTLQQTQTGEDGRFVFSGVAQGTYAIVAERSGYEQSTTVVTVGEVPLAEITVTMASDQALEIKVAAERLDRARNSLSPRTGSSEYSFDQKDIAALPEGDNTSFNQALLQAPGVANDSFGQLHIRGDHANIQYRINNVILPEGITGFGQALDTRFASRIDLLTGALPAQYGYRTAGVVEIETKSGFGQGGSVGIYGGSHNTINPSFELAGATQTGLSYYITGSYTQNDLGIENPTSSVNAIHDHTSQPKGFVYLSQLLNPTTKASFIAGSSVGKFEIPNNPAQDPNPDFLAQAGVAGFNSADLNETQREVNNYAILAFQSSLRNGLDYQVALFTRYSSVTFNPDPIGDLVFNGVASQVFRSAFTNGLQADGSNRLNAAHTLRVGLSASTENDRSDNTSTVFTTDPNTGNVNGGPITIVDNNPKNGNRLYGVYLQDEWRMTEKFTLNYGARLDEMDAFVRAGQLSPRIGFVYKDTPQTTYHAGYARYFTPPPNELVSSKTLALFDNTTNAGASDVNSPVQPERSHYFDAGVTHQLTTSLNLGLDGYYKYARNLIDEGQFGQALIFTPFNYDRAKVYGVELTGNYKKNAVSAYANLAYSVARATEIKSAEFNFAPDELAFIASNWVYLDHDQRYTASAGASYLWQRTTFTADAYYGSGLRRGFANTEKLPPYTHANIGMVQHFDTRELGKLDLRLVIVNVFDQSYELRDGTGIGVGAPQFGPRRAYYAGLSKMF
jgi:outer membrane receptor protein involved in Fe transport